MVELVRYSKGKPKHKGVYACRVPDLDCPFDFRLLKDVFLFWDDNQWWYLSSDQRFRMEVLGWIGPLQRKIEGAYNDVLRKPTNH